MGYIVVTIVLILFGLGAWFGIQNINDQTPDMYDEPDEEESEETDDHQK